MHIRSLQQDSAWYHMLILDIFRPYKKNNPRLHSFLTSDSAVEEAYKASLGQLKYIVRTEGVYPQPRRSICLWHTVYLYVANSMLSDSKDPERRYYFLLCIQGYRELYRSFPAARSIVKGLLAMAMSKDVLSWNECNVILSQLRMFQEPRDLSDTAQISFIIDQDLALQNPNSAKVSDLADRFTDLYLFQTFTTDNDPK